MSKNKSQSLHFYKYLCQKIGSEEDVRIRRLAYLADDINHSDRLQVTSGSIGEGLDLKGSDLDLMFIESIFIVNESDSYAGVPSIGVPLIMDTENTHPCFTQLHVPIDFQLSVNDGEICLDPRIEQMLEKDCLKSRLSNELFKSIHFNMNSKFSRHIQKTIHGPCISDLAGKNDYAYCLKCDKWISQAHSWVSRPRTTWPAPEIITKIISCGVLFVPIGCKGSLQENLEWRISFSVAEKILIFSFSHTQLLCYALLKILLKDIVDKYEDLKGLLCSYFLKTLVFWISEESDPSFWNPDNIIPCFMACLKRLLYCVEYSTLLHYFIPDYNLFYLRFNTDLKDKMAKVLKNLYQQGINCYASSETLSDFTRLNCEVPVSFTPQTSISFKFTPKCRNKKPIQFLCCMLQHCRTALSRRIFISHLSQQHQICLQALNIQKISSNKQIYCKYKHDLSHLLVGTKSGTVPGWLMLASFFYVHKNYYASLTIINHALKRHQDESFRQYTLSTSLIQNMKSVMTLLKKHRLDTILGTSKLILDSDCLFLPLELHVPVPNLERFIFTTLPFVHFLSFLCYYHLHDSTSCMQSIRLIFQIYQNAKDNLDHCFIIDSTRFLGKAHEMMGNTITARKWFQINAANENHEYDDKKNMVVKKFVF